MLVCTQTGKRYSLESPIWQSEAGALLKIDYQGDFKKEYLSGRPYSFWRYRELLALHHQAAPLCLAESITPLVFIDILGCRVAFKLDYLFPSGSYKDRGAAVMLSHAKYIGINEIVQDSSGNAGCSVAQYAAFAQIKCHIYVPSDTSSAKLAQIQFYGAHLHKIEGSRQATAQAAYQAAQAAYYASHVWNPFFFEGTKTWAFEVCEQLHWKAPDAVVLPVGNGTLVIGAYIGFKQLFELGLISHIPKLIGVQSANCNFLESAFDSKVALKNQPTLAEGIAIESPLRGSEILAYIRQTEGCILSVEEDEIMHTWKEIALQGYYIEATSAAVVTGVKKYVHNFSKANEQIVSLFTGSGLKSTEKVLKALAK